MGALVLFYALSFAPVAWMADKFNISNNGVVGKGLIMFYYPHFIGAAHNEWYFRYVSWWLGRTPSHEEYLRFQKDFAETGPH